MVQLAFQLYDTGDYTLDELVNELYDRSLHALPTTKHPAKKVSINKPSQLLRDRYYLGYVTYKGEEIRGRHEPLIDEDLFDRVQDRLNSRARAKERRRVHHHYLKGSLYLGRCRRAGITQRMINQRTVNGHGSEYLYFFCHNKRNGTCQAPHVHVDRVEAAVERLIPRSASHNPSSPASAPRSTPSSTKRRKRHGCCTSSSPANSKNSTPRKKT
ncbi:recombinase family protein [Actinopolyspora mortivallis]|uniref:recombinase family protein n=1 Tax=Actinopolyspora mortivallis TaxID=33906 RepID=UPI0035BE670A